MLGNDLTQGLRTVILGDIVDAADAAVGLEHQGIADEAGQHDAVCTPVQGNQHHAVRVAQVSGLAAPLVHAQQQVMRLSVHHRGQLIIGDHFNGLGCIRQGKPRQQHQQAEEKRTCSAHLFRLAFVNGPVPEFSGNHTDQLRLPGGRAPAFFLGYIKHKR